ncbi:AMP-binding protein [Streptomyces roseochromogenus]|uniref:AMP-dependent synthetase/ligase domain-containing protein n=1 Tax=Streptomyces roseochromogenus subsp. oscitans DS 12.976 TaxID=1352936 RepID=V6JH96_STRRC|nr:AMP-binding protein [Streptomyces roseochromogenus]EST18531.1 hypothetical protein M878_45255 [Streptomyces roseochromogenus subsp. oscitans DS 12.976]
MTSDTVTPPVAPARHRTAPAVGSVTGLNRFFEDACDSTPHAVALEIGAQRLSYAELDARANQVAHRLRRLGIGPDSRVGLLLPRSAEMYASLLGVCKAGAAFVPVDPAAPADRVTFILQDAGADALLTASARTADAVRAMPPRTCAVIEADSGPGTSRRCPPHVRTKGRGKWRTRWPT